MSILLVFMSDLVLWLLLTSSPCYRIFGAVWNKLIYIFFSAKMCHIYDLTSRIRGKRQIQKTRIIILTKHSYHDMISSISTDKLPVLRFNRDFNLKGPFCKNQLKISPQGGSISPNVFFFVVVLKDIFKLIIFFSF